MVIATAAALLCGGAFVLFRRRPVSPALARAFMALSVTIIALQLGAQLTRLATGLPLEAARSAMAALAYGWAAGLGALLADAWRRRAPFAPAAVAGISILISGKFVSFEIGKALHPVEMEQFFIDSGYPAWLHYAVMALEIAGSAGLLLHWKLKTGPLAAAGLALIMLGAVATHARNGDPFAASYDAVLQLAFLTALLAMYAANRAAKKPRPNSAVG